MSAPDDLSRALSLSRAELADAPIAAVLMRALAASGDDPLEGVLVALRSDVEVAARLSEGAGHRDVAVSLDGIGRRLDAAIELRRRELRPKTGRNAR